MELTKVSVIDYDKKDCNPIACPQCNSHTFTLFEVIQKTDSHINHVHLRCLQCDLSWCMKSAELHKMAEIKKAHDLMMDQLTTTQNECTRLLNENRKYKDNEKSTHLGTQFNANKEGIQIPDLSERS